MLVVNTALFNTFVLFKNEFDVYLLKKMNVTFEHVM